MRPASERSTFKPSKFNHTCSGCGRRIRVGQMVWSAKRAGVRCEQCGRHPDGSEPSRSPSIPAFKSATCDSDTVHRVTWNSLREAVDDALADYADNPANLELLRKCSRKDYSGRSEWSNYFTRQRLLDEVASPSPELRDAVDQMREQIREDVALPTTPRRRVRHGQDYGDELDSDRFLSRQPNPWDRSVREPQPRRTVRIGCNVSVSGARRPAELLWRGAAAVALADALTERGVNVEIVLFKCVSEVTDRVKFGLVRCTLKEAHMPLDLAAVTTVLCEIAFARLVAVRGAARHWPGKLDEGFGYPQKLPQSERKTVDFVIEADVLCREQAEAWVKDCLAQATTQAAE